MEVRINAGKHAKPAILVNVPKLITDSMQKFLSR